MRKGIELPMNTLVVVSIAVLILMAMIAFFMSGFNKPSGNQAKYSQLLAECQKWAVTGCEGKTINDIKKNYESLWNAYKSWKGSEPSDVDEIRKVCGCTGAESKTESQSQ